MKIIVLVIISIFLVSGCVFGEDQIDSFEDCVYYGYPVMESYPRQCRVGDELFIEGYVGTLDGLSLEEARHLAEKSECSAEGELSEVFNYNGNTKTWWFDIVLEKDGCSPACVVSEETRSAEINWRCTGLQNH